jgi:hypothetical protein
MFKPSEGNIRGCVNIPCPEGIIKSITPRPLTPLLAEVVSRRLIGTEWDIGLFGEKSKEQRKKDLKKRGLWQKKNRKYKIEFYRKGVSNISDDMGEIENVGIDSIEEIENESFTIFTKKPMNTETIKKMEGLSFIDGITHISRVEVR